MKTYLAVTSALFALLTVVHVWRIVAESGTPVRDPWFMLTTAISALLCIWGSRLYLASRANQGTRAS